MKKLLVLLLISFILPNISVSRAAEYGDLYDVDWCPCNPEDVYGTDGSVVLGKTVMCPCSSKFKGLKRTLEKDMRHLEYETKKTIRKAKNFKYYVGVDYNKSQVNTSKENINFQDIIFTNTAGVNIPASEMIDHQDNIGFVIGTRPHKNLGIEAFYNRSYNKNEVTKIDNTTLNESDHHMVDTFISKYQAFGIDVLGYLPITDYFDFIGFVGVGKYMFDNSAKFKTYFLEGGNSSVLDTASFEFNEDEIGLRIGAGIQFNIARGLVLRSMYRYIRLKTDTINSLQEYSIGLRFLF